MYISLRQGIITVRFQGATNADVGAFYVRLLTAATTGLKDLQAGSLHVLVQHGYLTVAGLYPTCFSNCSVASPLRGITDQRDLLFFKKVGNPDESGRHFRLPLKPPRATIAGSTPPQACFKSLCTILLAESGSRINQHPPKAPMLVNC